jgi:cytochrome c peroxidase
MPLFAFPSVSRLQARRNTLTVLAFSLGVAAAAPAAAGESEGVDDKVSSLMTIPVPRPANLGAYVRNEQAAIRLGKALFWDIQAGSDGITACATCHHKGGSDSRTVASTNPHGAVSGWVPNQPATAADFPIRSRQVFGSAGVVKRTFGGLSGTPVDNGVTVSDPIFSIGVGGVPTNIRQVTDRRAQTVVNAAYYYRGFWDGRARETFNGVNGAGSTDPNASVVQVLADGSLSAVKISLSNASLASQAVGPINSAVEMAWSGRTMPDVGRKLLSPGVRPLGLQSVSGTDSVLGTLSQGTGLATTYDQLVRDAFQPAWWNSTNCVDGAKAMVACTVPGAMTVMESNFALFYGLALQLYQSTLIANQSALDRNQLNAQQKRGKTVYENQGKCNDCHGGAETTQASVRNVRATVPFKASTGFFNIGVRPASEDGGLKDPGLAGLGLMKSPHMRALDVRAPYFHNGGAATLRQVVDFYNRGGDFKSGGGGTQDLRKSLGLTEAQKNDLVAFMLSMSDDRVTFARKPFDHPSLPLPTGVNPLTGADIVETLPAVGAAGRATPWPTFLGLSPYAP